MSDWRITKPSLLESLDHLLETGLYSDVQFLLGPKRHAVNAHKTILSARSEVMATMLRERWTQGQFQEQLGRAVIELPETTGKNAFKHFLKYLYTEQISVQSIGVDQTLEVLHLAHFYQVFDLLSTLSDQLKSAIKAQNCLQMYLQSRFIHEELSKEAFNYFIKNIHAVAADDAFLHWDMETVSSILYHDAVDVAEVDLFKALLKWRDFEPNNAVRQQAAKSFFRLIRYPLMGVDSFIEAVVNSGVLTPADIIDLFTYFNSKGQVSMSKFSTTPRCSASAQSPQSIEFSTKLFNSDTTMQVYVGPGRIDTPFRRLNNRAIVSGNNDITFAATVKSSHPLILEGLVLYGMRNCRTTLSYRTSVSVTTVNQTSVSESEVILNSNETTFDMTLAKGIYLDSSCTNNIEIKICITDRNPMGSRSMQCIHFGSGTTVREPSILHTYIHSSYGDIQGNQGETIIPLGTGGSIKVQVTAVGSRYQNVEHQNVIPRYNPVHSFRFRYDRRVDHGPSQCTIV